MAYLLNLFEIPLISYASTSAILSDKNRFKYFARTVPPDIYQAKAMADIVQYFNWSYVSTISSMGDYGEGGIEALRYELTARNICIAMEAKLPELPRREHFENILQDLIATKSTVVALFLRIEDANGLLSAAQYLNITNKFFWIASDGWGNSIRPGKYFTDISRGAITLELKSNFIPKFNEEFQLRKPKKNFENPWFDEFWESSHNCQFNSNEKKKCTGKEKFPYFQQDSKLQFVYDAVYSVAYALHEMLKDYCWINENKLQCMEKELTQNQSIFYNKYLLQVNFKSKSKTFYSYFFHIFNIQYSFNTDNPPICRSVWRRR